MVLLPKPALAPLTARVLPMGLAAAFALSACGSDTPAAKPKADAAADTTADTADAAADIAGDTSATAGDAEGSTDWKAAFDHVFPQDRVVDLRLTFAPGDWAKLLLDWQQNQKKTEFAAAFFFDGETLAAIGVRLKGLNGLNLPDGPINLAGKYPLKLDFNAQGGARFHGVDTLSLNTNSQDPSMMRERLALQMYQAMGIPASRAAYAKLQVDGKAVGLYNAVQVLDKRYLKERFGTAAGADDGNLYKCVYNGDNICMLGWRGDKKSDYYRTDCPPGFDECGFVQKTNEDDAALNSYADLIELIRVINQTPDEQFAAELAKVFDVEAFVRVAAVAYAISNHDSYFGKGHNYYLYRHPGSGKFQYLPWDLDLTYGTTSCAAPATDPTCGSLDNHLLIKRVLAVPKWRQAYLQDLQQVVDQYLTVAQHQLWIGKLDALLAGELAAAPNGPDPAAYQAARDEVLAFVQARRSDLLAKLAELQEP